MDVVRGDPREVGPGAVMSTSFGFGGHNATLVVRSRRDRQRKRAPRRQARSGHGGPQPGLHRLLGGRARPAGGRRGHAHVVRSRHAPDHRPPPTPGGPRGARAGRPVDRRPGCARRPCRWAPRMGGPRHRVLAGVVSGRGVRRAPWADVATALEVSSYSLAALARACRPVLGEGGSIVGLDFDATKAWPAYNWMGVSKAPLESVSRYLTRELGPDGIGEPRGRWSLRTIAARSIPGFSQFFGGQDHRALARLGDRRPETSGGGLQLPCSTCSPRPQARSSTSTAAPTPWASELSRPCHESVTLGCREVEPALWPSPPTPTPPHHGELLDPRQYRRTVGRPLQADRRGNRDGRSTSDTIGMIDGPGASSPVESVLRRAHGCLRPAKRAAARR